MASASADTFYVYILRCSNGSLYVGHTDNVEKRLIRHNAGRGPKWTADHRPVELIYSEFIFGKASAVRRELQIKRWSIAKKLALATGNRAKLKSLAKRHVR